MEDLLRVTSGRSDPTLANILTGIPSLFSNFAKILKISSVYKTEPLLYKQQDDFFNIVI